MGKLTKAVSPDGNQHISIMAGPQPISYGHMEFLDPWLAKQLRQRARGKVIPEKVPTFLTSAWDNFDLSPPTMKSDHLYRLVGVPVLNEGTDVISFISQTNKVRDKGIVFIFDRYDSETRNVLNGWLNALGCVPLVLIGETNLQVAYIRAEAHLINDLNSDVPAYYARSVKRNRDAVRNVRLMHPVSAGLYIFSLLAESCDELVVTRDTVTGLISASRLN